MKTRFGFYAVLAAGLAAVFAAPASAAAPAFNWTGIYIGVNSGFGAAGESWRYSVGTSADQWLHGGVAGGTIGWNFLQTGPYVFGVEADGDWTHLSGHTSCPNPSYACTNVISDLFTFRGRAGYAVRDRLLVFGTFGTAGGQNNPTVPGPSVITYPSKMTWGVDHRCGRRICLRRHVERHVDRQDRISLR